MKLGRYEVIRELGQGGMATAFLAYAPGGQTVVLKTPHLNSDDLCDRLRDEARIGIRLAHPALVETLDLFEDNGKPVLVVAYIDGVSVDGLRRKGPVNPAAVARIGWQIAQGLHAVHSATDERGRPLHMVHRDVTAPNVLVDKSGDARLIDLGIARSVENLAATEPGTIKGTVRYLAPELLQGLPPTPQSDLWGLGCVLFEAATGRPVHEGAPAQTMISILRTHPLEKPEAQHIHPVLRDALALIFEPDHNRRISDGFELAEALQRTEAELGEGELSLAAAVIETAGEQDEVTRAKAQAGAPVELSRVPDAKVEPATPPPGTPPASPAAGTAAPPAKPVSPFGPQASSGVFPGTASAPKPQPTFEVPKAQPRWSTPPTSGTFSHPPEGGESPPEGPPRTPLTPAPMAGVPNPFSGARDLEVESRPRKGMRLITVPVHKPAERADPNSPLIVFVKKMFVLGLIAIAVGLAWRFAIKPMLKGDEGKRSTAPTLVAPATLASAAGRDAGCGQRHGKA